ncbi:unnamed protein product [Didymodactylos carnosus]|uniref:DUF72 domain-containing protein n=1 Tax=Didymodactylos carnosus TaxID=1234261 RepID=A0A814KBS1_9BILA|nr:unnamed protein product [Didymodactylos carnosus]CAF1213182.1 unnamed protein product [Didymodactylos carnosus]CAF3820186.1 unnamed protein product [Didymodactylos carnosus]CAF4022001.1 unnamed protein product [Didymodactylos carnosus]
MSSVRTTTRSGTKRKRATDDKLVKKVKPDDRKIKDFFLTNGTIVAATAKRVRQEENESDNRIPLFSDQCPVHIGCSGYSYRGWHSNNYYPPKHGAKKEFQYYSKEFDSVEINSTFYNIPADSVFVDWSKRVPRPSFRYIIKVNKYFTHMKLLNQDDEFISRWNDFYRKCQLLGSSLGPILFQLPPRFKYTNATLAQLNRLETVLPKTAQFVFEFRNTSWFTDEVYQVLRKNNWCLCVVDCYGGWCGDLANGMTPRDPDVHLTCDWALYYRFHGKTGQYMGSYGKNSMKNYAQIATKHLDTHPNLQLYFYFNNTDNEHPPSAIKDSRHLADAFKELDIIATD